jgi:hypothetical protein
MTTAAVVREHPISFDDGKSQALAGKLLGALNGSALILKRAVSDVQTGLDLNHRRKSHRARLRGRFGLCSHRSLPAAPAGGPGCGRAIQQACCLLRTLSI